MKFEEIKQSLVGALGIPPAEAEIQEELIAEFGESVLERLFVEVYERLPEEKREKFKELSLGEDDQAMALFLNENVPNIQTLIENTIRDEAFLFRQDIEDAAREIAAAGQEERKKEASKPE